MFFLLAVRLRWWFEILIGFPFWFLCFGFSFSWFALDAAQR
jgi:hypothetical protein